MVAVSVTSAPCERCVSRTVAKTKSNPVEAGEENTNTVLQVSRVGETRYAATNNCYFRADATETVGVRSV